MIGLLNLCGIEGQELESQLPRIKKAFDKLGITEGDIEQGKQRLNTYYDMDLKSVRKALRLCLLETVNALLSREEGKTKVIYGFMSGALGMIGSALVSKSKEVYATPLDFMFPLILGCIFGKSVPLLEAGEKKWLKAGGVAHCGNLKAVVGLFALDLVPRPDLIVTSGFNCETAPQSLYLLHYLYDIPVCYFDTCLDVQLGEDPEATKRTVDFGVKSLKNLVARIQEVVGFEITDDMLRETLDARKKLAEATGRVNGLIEKSDPLPMRPATANIWAVLGSLPLSLDRLPEAIDAVNTEYEELKERIDKGIGVVEKGAPRVIAPLPMHHGDPRMEHLVTELGIALVPSAASGPPTGPPTEGEISPYLEMSQHLGGPMSTGLPGRIAMIVNVCKQLQVDGLLDRQHAGCRVMIGDGIIMKEVVEKEVGIPVLFLEWENFDPRVYNHEEYKRQLEVFKTMMTKKSG